jgi:hypothetical protein
VLDDKDGQQQYIVKQWTGRNKRECVPRWLTVHSNWDEEVQDKERKLRERIAIDFVEFRDTISQLTGSRTELTSLNCMI